MANDVFKSGTKVQWYDSKRPGSKSGVVVGQARIPECVVIEWDDENFSVSTENMDDIEEVPTTAEMFRFQINGKEFMPIVAGSAIEAAERACLRFAQTNNSGEEHKVLVTSSLNFTHEFTMKVTAEVVECITKKIPGFPSGK